MKNISFSLLLFLCLGIVLTSNNAFAQKFTGKYWKCNGFSSGHYDPDYNTKVENMFDDAKLFFDTNDNFIITFRNGKRYTLGYEWKADTKVLMLNFTGQDLNDPNINFLRYYGLLCHVDDVFGDEILALTFLPPNKSHTFDLDAIPQFVLSFRKE